MPDVQLTECHIGSENDRARCRAFCRMQKRQGRAPTVCSVGCGTEGKAPAVCSV
ncbi:hypothetical protein [Marvinbryantia formatexigens]|uniref:hypothetical protein n=1 Tax=Marvinbryantia formatexigens TaxID=168384 RepID=UPI001A9A5947|nr:hypothetical protein [Marvinbryantia formatexigens]